MFDRMLPRGPGKLKLSKMNMGGIGTAMMRSIMKDKNIDSLEELIDGVEIGGVGTYLGEAEESNVNLFV